MFHDSKRLITIFWVLRKYGIFRLLTEKTGIQWLAYFNIGTAHHTADPGTRLCDALQTLGPIFIKLGQSLSTRPDLISPEIAESLILLQDKVPAFSSEIAVQSIETSLKKPIHELFDTFDPVPIGSASIAQVHAAQLHSGEQVVVKVLRPHIEKSVKQDIHILHKLTKFAQTFLPKLSILRLHEVVAEVEKTLHYELDLIREAANSSVLKRNLADMPSVKIPRVYWDHTATRVATMERIYGTCIADRETLLAQGADLPHIARMGVELFFTQVFHHRYFHADMHPGNVFIDMTSPHAPQFILVDFGIMGTLSSVDQSYLAQNLLAFIHRDYRKVAELHIESGWVPSTIRLDEFEAAIRTVCEPMFERPISDISFGKLLMRLFQTAQQFQMRIQPQLILLQKTILNVEGITRHLYPELNVWETARPIIESWMKDRVGFKAALTTITREWPYWVATLPQLPATLMKTLEALATSKSSGPGH